MKSQYNIIVGVALILGVAIGFIFPKERYFSIVKNMEVSKEDYERYSSPTYFTVIKSFNIEYGVATSVLVIGLGLLCVGIAARRKKV